jgi:hypothetical protein
MNAKQQFLFLGVVPAGTGLVLLVTAFNLALPALVTPALLTLAFAALGTGLANCLYRRIVFTNPNRRRFELIVWRGIAAIPFGCAFAVLGLMILAATLAHASGISADAMRETVFARPGLLLAPLGVMLLFSSVGYAIGFRDDTSDNAGCHILLSIPARLAALILFVIGAALLGIGGWELLLPVDFDRWIESLM